MRKLLGLSILTLLAMALMMVVIGTAAAKPSFQGPFDSAYPDSPLAGNCSVCHTGPASGSTVNSYGLDYKASGFAAIESDDSDGDGVNNITEIMAGSFPGDSGSIPQTTTTTTTTTTTGAPGTTAPPTTATPTTSTPPTTTPPTTTVVPASGGMTKTYDVGDAGRVTITLDGNRIVDVDVDANDGWSCRIDEQYWKEVEVECEGFGQEVEFEAEVEHGVLEVEVEVEVDHNDDDDDHGRNHDDEDDDDDDHDDDDDGDDEDDDD